jgi:hypothetical protein
MERKRLTREAQSANGALGYLVFALAMLAALATGASARAQAPPPKIETFLKRCETNRRGRILELEHTLRRLRHQAQSAQVVAQTRQLQDELRLLRANQDLLIPTLAYPPEKGAMGRLPELTFHVDEVLPPDLLLGRSNFLVGLGSVQRFQFRPEKVHERAVFFITGVDAQKFTAGGDIQLPETFEVVEQRSYRTADGRPGRAWVLKVADMSQVYRYFRQNRN